MTAYYNEIDPYCCQWLRNLIDAGHIARGDVDDRSIEDVTPDDVRGYTQCHYFAGIGVWSYALRLAGWPDDRPVWTGSCPCQPFSQAGKGAGFDDERHLWPAWFHLISECRPSVVFGEQVAAGIRHGWLDLVRADLENEGYACGHSVFGAHSVGAPHQRQRAYFVADASLGLNERQHEQAGLLHESRHAGEAGDVGHAYHMRLEGREISGERAGERTARATGLASNRMADAESVGNDGPLRNHERQEVPETLGRSLAGFWSDAEWIPCRDGKARPVEPGSFPLAHGATARVGRLRAYGNAIVPQVAAQFIRAYLG